jgi:integrase
MPAGIEVRHTRTCRSSEGGRCNCEPSYRAQVWNKRDGLKHRKSFRTLAEAKAWRDEARVAIRRGALRKQISTRLREMGEAWLEDAGAGRVRNRSGDLYKPSSIRGYEKGLRLFVYPALGDARVSDLQVRDVQDLVDELDAAGVAPATIQTAVTPLRAIFGRALSRGEVSVNPTQGLRLPAVRSGKKRIASPEDAQRLLDALELADRALWATAFYGGLRRGELQALRWEDVDLANGVVHVRRSWDLVEGEVGPKSVKGRRRVPISAVLRSYLVEHKLASGRSEGLVFGESATRPFDPRKAARRADKAWEASKLERITFHEGRHTFASLMIAAGVNAKALSTYMGHANIAVTFDLYGHLMPGNEAEAAGLLDSYLCRSA